MILHLPDLLVPLPVLLLLLLPKEDVLLDRHVLDPRLLADVGRAATGHGHGTCGREIERAVNAVVTCYNDFFKREELF